MDRTVDDETREARSRIVSKTMEGAKQAARAAAKSNNFMVLPALDMKWFATEVARSDDVKFVPDYFPFTEPSVEVRMKHPVLGWMELGGAGIFRPEVTGPQGLDCPVIAWGLGLDRMAMVALGINDIRELFSNNPKGLNLVRETVARL